MKAFICVTNRGISQGVTCQCTSCRKQTSSLFRASHRLLDVSAFRFLRQPHHLKWYRSVCDHQERGFYSNCGSLICVRPSRKPKPEEYDPLAAYLGMPQAHEKPKLEGGKLEPLKVDGIIVSLEHDGGHESDSGSSSGWTVRGDSESEHSDEHVDYIEFTIGTVDPLFLHGHGRVFVRVAKDMVDGDFFYTGIRDGGAANPGPVPEEGYGMALAGGEGGNHCFYLNAIAGVTDNIPAAGFGRGRQWRRYPQ